jgi:hypothetical protein
VNDLLFLIGLRGIRTFRYTEGRALASPYSHRVTVMYLEEFIKEGSVEVSPGEEPVLRCGSQEVDFRRVGACYALLMDLPRRLVRDGLIGERDWHPYRSRLNALILALHRTNCLVINRPLFDLGNGSKPLQTFDLARLGFRVPRSLATNSPEKALAFAEELGWRVIYKSTSALPSIANRLTPDRRTDLERIRACPILLQEEVAGPDVRVHVVGDRAFAERIDFSDGVDARYSPRASRQFRSIELPDHVRRRCLDLVALSGLWIVGIDFKLDPETGEYVALEANPTPGYDVYDYRSGGQISEALLRLMAAGASPAVCGHDAWLSSTGNHGGRAAGQMGLTWE